MDEILYELRDHSAGLNAGRWDYIFSIIKKFNSRPDFLLPDRAQVTMTVPFMRAYTELLVKTCHRRGAFAMGGMAAFIPSRRDPKVNEVALPKVQRRQAARVARRLRRHVGGASRTWCRSRATCLPSSWATAPTSSSGSGRSVGRVAHELLDLRVPDGQITEAGLRSNI